MKKKLLLTLMSFISSMISADFQKLLNSRYQNNSWRIRLLTSNLMSAQVIDSTAKTKKIEVLESIVRKKSSCGSDQVDESVDKQPQIICLTSRHLGVGIWFKNDESTNGPHKSSLPISFASARRRSLSIDTEVASLIDDKDIYPAPKNVLKLISPSDNSTPLRSHNLTFYELASSPNPNEEEIKKQLQNKDNQEELHTSDLLHQCFRNGEVSLELFRRMLELRSSPEKQDSLKK